MNSESDIIISRIDKESGALAYINEQQWVADISALSADIKEKKEKLILSIEEIKGKNPPIKENSFFRGLFKSYDVKESIAALYEDQRKVNAGVLSTIQQTNDYILHILKLMKVLATADVDIYKLMEEHSLNLVEVKNIFKDLCCQYGIKDEEIEKLFEGSFQRAYQLRNRINHLKEEIAGLNDKIQAFEQKFNQFDCDVTMKLQKVISVTKQMCEQNHADCEVVVKQNETYINQTFIKYDKIIKELNQEVITSLREEKEQILLLQNELISVVQKELEATKGVIDQLFREQNDKISLQNTEIAKLKEKSFLDSAVYKITIGIVAIAGLVTAIMG